MDDLTVIEIIKVSGAPWYAGQIGKRYKVKADPMMSKGLAKYRVYTDDGEPTNGFVGNEDYKIVHQAKSDDPRFPEPFTTTAEHEKLGCIGVYSVADRQDVINPESYASKFFGRR